jgi:hypothetical protein
VQDRGSNTKITAARLGVKMIKLKNEWKLFKQDFARQCNESLLFRINWYVLKPLAVVLVIVTFIIL